MPYECEGCSLGWMGVGSGDVAALSAKKCKSVMFGRCSMRSLAARIPASSAMDVISSLTVPHLLLTLRLSIFEYVDTLDEERPKKKKKQIIHSFRFA